MWQFILQTIQELMERPWWAAIAGIGAGFLLFSAGMIWKKPRDRKRGLLVMGLCIIAGVLLYYYG